MADKPPFALTIPPSSTAFEKSDHLLPTPSPSLDDSPSSLFPFPCSHSHRQAPASTMATNSPHSEQSQQSQQSHAAMAPSAAPNGQKGITKLAINSLMSPPDPPLDSFSINHQSDLGKPAAANDHPMPMSPPISPYSKVVSTTEAPATLPGQAINDPVLYPSEEGSPSPASPSQAPLFAPAELEEHQSLVDSHVRSRSPTSFAQVAPPNREEYELVLHFQSRVAELYEANPLRWLRRERAFLMADRKRARTYQNIMPATKPVASKPQRTHRADRVSKPAPAPRPIRTHPNATATVPMRPAARRVSSTPEPSRRVVAPNREDKDFKTIQDFCPPLDSLPNKPNSLKVDWKGQPIDLSRDPYALLLHPDELSLAGNLRLDCATYLTSKRRIFERRLQCLRNGKEFRKTDAQQACKIDVNKASKLWTAFEKVGWLDTKWMRRFH